LSAAARVKGKGWPSATGALSYHFRKFELGVQHA
jgi:hypothetical protein